MSVKVGNVTLIQDHDYTIHNANGTEEITDFSSDAHYKGFQIHFTESSIDKIKGQTINLQYSTTVDYTRLTDGIQYTIRNKGGIPGHENDVTQTYKPVGKLEKQASVTGNHTEYKTNENITYSQLENNDGTTTVTFTIKDGYNSNPNNSFDILVIYYDVSIAKDEIWDDPSTGQHIYTNHASWGDNSTSTDVTVDREVATLAKTGAQLPQLDDNGEPMKDTQGNPVLSNTVRYYVTINQAAQDLDPVQDNLKLTDKLKLPSNIAGADLNVGSVHLYHFDMNAENHCGQEINPARYSYTYDSASHTMTFTVPDSTAMVLVYEYTIDRGSAAGELHLSNSVELTGVDGSKTDNQVQFQETSSSATVSKRTLTIYKVDGENYGTTLPEAKFKLEKFDTLSNWTVVNVTLVSDEKGQIVLDQTDDDSDDIYQSNVLYRLTETEAPTGYAKDKTPHYFVWVKADQTVNECKNEMESTLNSAGVDVNDVLFISNSSAIYVPNQSTTLKVEKVWLDDDGVEFPNPNVGELEVKLYQNTTRTNGVTVTVNWRDQYDNGETVSVQVKDGSSLTIDTGIWNSSYTYSVNHGPETSITSNELTLTITGDTVVDLKTPYSATITFSNYEQPSYVQTGEKELHDTVTLNKDNNWSYTWTDLPTTDNDGAPVYYTVEETTIPGYSVIYSSNNTTGVQTGLITITNQANGYVMPETGGSGTNLFTAGGLALLAAVGLMYIKQHRRRDESL